MSKVMVNLTEQAVVQDIEQVLETYALSPYQNAFAHPELRQKLMAWVLNHVQNVYSVEDLPIPSIPSQGSVQTVCTIDRDGDHTDVHCVIRQGIQEIIDEDKQTIARHLPDKEDAGLAPSHWFG